ncbi:hypothetical protein KSP39_PZI013511 [Platanthera zijinensis]|uniref:CRM-domain containing factor CFM3, chloroplastic/mitochondrial n=1 Tax=Platanthera zijinensis TaxID=2320716 RepID=A0AAP0BCX1_9ASPA
MLLSIPHYPSTHSLRSKTQLNPSPSPSFLPSPALRLKNLKPYTPHSRSSSREAAGKSAIQRISEKLRSLGYLPDDPAAAASGLPPTGPGSPGEIFIPTPREIPKHRVGYTIDPSWSTPEHPVPEPGSGDTITRFRELWKRDRHSSPPAGKDVKVPTVAELMLPRKELKRLTTLGIALTKRLKVGKAGITEGILNGIHERWRRSEVVKIRCEDISRMNMKRTHEILERKTGGLVVWRSGNIIVLYRGANYKYPYFDSTECKTENVDEDCSEPIVDSVVNNFAANTSIASRGSRVPTSLVARADKMENFNEDNSEPTMEGVAEEEITIAEASSTELSSTRARLPFVTGVGSPNKLRLQFPGEAQLNEEADRLLDGLGPRFTDWWGEDPLPVDGDLLPAIVPRFRKSFRLLPFGLRPQLTDRECTVLRRLSRHIPCHFALGRNKNLQGLAVSIIKLWERCEVAKIAVKRGAQNTNSQIMAEELKSLTGGTILSRDKYFIVLYRGKDFLPPAVSIAIEERRNWHSRHSLTSKDGASLCVSNFSSTVSVTNSSSDTELKETGEGERSLMVLRDAKSANSAVRKVEAMLTQANQKIEKTEKHLAKLEKATELVTVESDKEGISEEERYMLRRVGLSMKPFLLLGRRGVFDGTIENMHLHWKYRELVKIIFNDRCFENVESIARTLESESGGILVAVERVSKGYAVVIYRGKNYRRPANLRPKTLLNKKEALKRSLEAQRYESLKLRALRLSKTIDQLDCKNAGNDSKTNTALLTEFEGPNSSNGTTDEIEPIEIEDDSGSEPEVETNRSVESDFNDENFENMIVLEHQQGNRAIEISEHSLLSTSSIPMSCRGESIADDEILLAHRIPQREHVSNPTISGDACASEKPSVNLSTGEAQSLPGSSSSGSSWEQESDVKVNFRPVPLSNRERLLLRKQALKMRKRPVLSVGRSNILTGVAKTIKTHFKKHPLAIVNIKGRAKGTSVHELVFELEQATGSILVSREPNKIILYRGWGEGDLPGGIKDPVEVNQAAVSHQLIDAIRRECGLPSAEVQ